jgi:hypothetical protein
LAALDHLNAEIGEMRRVGALDRARWLTELRRCEHLTLLAEAQARTIEKLERQLDLRGERDTSSRRRSTLLS